MGKELSSVSPLLLNTVGGLVALLFVVMIINAITKLVRQYRPVPVPVSNGNGKSADDIFGKSVRFNLHAQEQSQACAKLIDMEKKIHEFDKYLGQLVDLGERQTKALEELVKLRSDFLKGIKSAS